MVELERMADPAAPEQIESVERMAGRKLPADYAAFLRVSNGGRPAPNEFPVGRSNSAAIVSYLSCEQILGKRARLGSRLDTGILPIAEVEGGNLVCLRPSTHGWDVVFWDHEAHEYEVLAESFSAFLELVKPFDPSAVVLQPGQVKKVWVDPDFFKKHNGT